MTCTCTQSSNVHVTDKQNHKDYNIPFHMVIQFFLIKKYQPPHHKYIESYILGFNT